MWPLWTRSANNWTQVQPINYHVSFFRIQKIAQQFYHLSWLTGLSHWNSGLSSSTGVDRWVRCFLERSYEDRWPMDRRAFSTHLEDHPCVQSWHLYILVPLGLSRCLSLAWFNIKVWKTLDNIIFTKKGYDEYTYSH